MNVVSLLSFPNSSEILGRVTTYALFHIPGVRAGGRWAGKEKEAIQVPSAGWAWGLPNVPALGGLALGNPVPNPAGLTNRIKGCSHSFTLAGFNLKYKVFKIS